MFREQSSQPPIWDSGKFSSSHSGSKSKPFPPLFEPFDAGREEFEAYVERIVCCMQVYDIGERDKLPYFIASIGVDAYTVLRKLTTPLKPLDLSFDRIIDKLSCYYAPEFTSDRDVRETENHYRTAEDKYREPVDNNFRDIEVRESDSRYHEPEPHYREQNNQRPTQFYANLEDVIKRAIETEVGPQEINLKSSRDLHPFAEYGDRMDSGASKNYLDRISRYGNARHPNVKGSNLSAFLSKPHNKGNIIASRRFEQNKLNAGKSSKGFGKAAPLKKKARPPKQQQPF